MALGEEDLPTAIATPGPTGLGSVAGMVGAFTSPRVAIPHAGPRDVCGMVGR